jgi:glucosamine--fructose-6-phosphate aminotransferase (isomerizing)
MCGIIAITRRRSTRPAPRAEEVLDRLDRVTGVLPEPGGSDQLSWLVGSAAELLEGVDRDLRGEPGLRALLADRSLVAGVAAAVARVDEAIEHAEGLLEAESGQVPELESLNAGLVRLKDAAWSLQRDRLRAAREVAQLGGSDLSPAAIAAFFSIQQALSNLDRLEVRGRDSAGLHVLVRNHGLALGSERVRNLLAGRTTDSLFQSGSVRVAEGHLGFVYKAAAEIGELGDNTATMRAAIMADELLHLALVAEGAQATVLAHTRWASVGIISEPNAHPVNSDELTRPISSTEPGSNGDSPDDVVDPGPYVTSVLNGDVDNFADLIAANRLSIAAEITTDAKVIPAMVSRAVEAGLDLDEAVRSTVVQFEGSVAIGVSTAGAPADLHLALRGSGQGVFVGLAEDAFVVASEPYGVVEDCELYLRMDGETPADPDNPTASQGQILRLSGGLAGQADGVSRVAYDGTPLPIEAGEWKTPDVTTRDIDRGDAPHFLLKEISESPLSFRKTLRGRLVEADGRYRVTLPPETMPPDLAARLEGVRRIIVIGQGTAAVAGQAVATAIGDALVGSGVVVEPITATELSGFQLTEDMADTLVVAISQSGTTTDTNRTVDLARSRGAAVIAIVNRRGSDLVDKADGVLYTSDGRDVEMSVASTKAFYAQIAAGFLLADALADLIEGETTSIEERQSVLTGLAALPEAMIATLALRPQIGVAAARHAPSRRYWAMVGNGANAVAAREVRIKLSELCYKSIACDITEDKKHIDLSSEPMILVCAAGLGGSNADDVAKEVAIFRAHKAAPIVIATEGEQRFSAALEVIGVPEVHPKLAFVLSTIVGHLFGYEAALAIDASARPLREARGIIESYVGAASGDWFESFGVEVLPFSARFFDGLRTGTYNGHLEASTAVRLSALLRFADGQVPLDAYQVMLGKVGTPGVVVEDLAAALTDAIEELTRPIDAIKHQAKTVTVGISRADESLLQAPVIQAVLATGCPRDRLSYRSLRTLAAISPAVAEVVGYTRYQVESLVVDGTDVTGRLTVTDKGGIATGIVSRVDREPSLRGTKHRVVVEREPFVSVGSDGRVVLIVPEVKDEQAVGLTLCHLALNENLGAATARAVLQGYRNRYRQLVDVVTERQPTFREDLLAQVSTVELLTAPISDVAARWMEG